MKVLLYSSRLTPASSQMYLLSNKDSFDKKWITGKCGTGRLCPHWVSSFWTSMVHTSNKVMVVQVVQRAQTDAPSDTIRRDVRSNMQDVFFRLTKPTGWSGTQCSGISVGWFECNNECNRLVGYSVGFGRNTQKSSATQRGEMKTYMGRENRTEMWKTGQRNGKISLKLLKCLNYVPLLFFIGAKCIYW